MYYQSFYVIDGDTYKPVRGWCDVINVPHHGVVNIGICRVGKRQSQYQAFDRATGYPISKRKYKSVKDVMRALNIYTLGRIADWLHTPAMEAEQWRLMYHVFDVERSGENE